VICHGIPDQRELQEGDIVNVDVTAFIGGYHGDLNETFCVGEVSGMRKAPRKAGGDSSPPLRGSCMQCMDISHSIYKRDDLQAYMMA